MSETVTTTAAQDTPIAGGDATSSREAELLYGNTETPKIEGTQESIKTEASTETKQADSPKTEEAAKSEAEIKYDLKLPEDSLLERKHVEEIASFAKEQKLSNEVAQKMLEREHNAISAFAAAQEQQFEKLKTEWYEQAQLDKEIGGDLFAESAENAKRVVNRFASAALKEELNKTGFGNHPELLRVFARIGKAMADDKFIKPGVNPGTSRSVESIFYPDQK